jgi:hypothetical protein
MSSRQAALPGLYVGDRHNKVDGSGDYSTIAPENLTALAHLPVSVFT